jgi:hypothetical protein
MINPRKKPMELRSFPRTEVKAHENSEVRVQFVTHRNIEAPPPAIGGLIEMLLRIGKNQEKTTFSMKEVSLPPLSMPV